MRILIAEDEMSHIMLMEMLMTKWGYDYDIVKNGRDAVNLAAETGGKYDLCLMDIDMPVMDGFEAARLIRKKTKYLPIIAMTGDISIKDKYSDYGMNDYIRKPFYFDELHNKIVELTITQL